MQTGWKASKYVNTANQEQANNLSQNQTKNSEESNKNYLQKIICIKKLKNFFNA